jgi:hypothetical protein
VGSDDSPAIGKKKSRTKLRTIRSVQHNPLTDNESEAMDQAIAQMRSADYNDDDVEVSSRFALNSGGDEMIMGQSAQGGQKRASASQKIPLASKKPPEERQAEGGRGSHHSLSSNKRKSSSGIRTARCSTRQIQGGSPRPVSAFLSDSSNPTAADSPGLFAPPPLVPL